MAKYAKRISVFGESEADGSLQLQPCRQKIKVTCLLCCRLVFQKIQHEVEVEKMKKKRNAIFKNLCDELHLRWDEIPDECLEEMFPLCKECFEKVKRLWEYNEEIKRIQGKKAVTVLQIRRTVTDGEVPPKIENPNPLEVNAEAKKFKRLREVILEANGDAWRNDSQHSDDLIDEFLNGSEDIEIAAQNSEPIMETVMNGVAPVDSFNPIAAPRIHFPSASQGNSSNDQNVMDNNCCVFCAKAFFTKGELMQHLLSHVREKPFTCNVCGKEFGMNGDLTRHIRTHTGERPFKCNLCFKTCSQKYNLELHLRTHTGEKPYKCNLCFKTYIQKSSLESHLRTHTREKPFKCNLCFKTFIQRSSLGCHLKTHVRK